MKNLLNLCKAISTSMWLTKKSNWCFRCKDQELQPDFSDIRKEASKHGLECTYFPASTSFNQQTGEQVASLAQFVIHTPKDTTDDEMLSAF